MLTRWFSRIILGTLALIVLGIAWFVIARPVVVLPRLNLAPGFGLKDAAGQLVTSEDGRGAVTLYTFAYSRCTQDCTSTYQNLQALDAQFKDRTALTPPLRLITLTLDPAHDTPEILKAAPLPFTPGALNWQWLTGSEADMKRVAGTGFQVPYTRKPDGSLFFEPRYVLVDGTGLVRMDLPGYRVTPAVLASYIDILYQEIGQAEGVNRLAYEAAHFFACYPR